MKMCSDVKIGWGHHTKNCAQMFILDVKGGDTAHQGVIFPAGVRVFPAGNLQHLTGLTGNFSPKSFIFEAFESSGQYG